MIKKILIVAGIILTGVVYLHTPANASVSKPADPTTYHIQNTSAGGCLKDNGTGYAYLVYTCSVSSNFTEAAEITEGGDQYYLLEDGAGTSDVCMQEYAHEIIAATCNAGIAAQLWSVDGFPALYNWYDVSQDSGDIGRKSSDSPFIAEMLNPGGADLWELTVTS
jgi:hypothetical protein